MMKWLTCTTTIPPRRLSRLSLLALIDLTTEAYLVGLEHVSVNLFAIASEFIAETVADIVATAVAIAGIIVFVMTALITISMNLAA
jgi:hypothetical protein